MTTPSRGGGWAVAGLIALSIVPVLAGGARLVQLASGAPLTADNARFVAAPWPVVLHVIGSAIYCVLGALQFWPGLRRRWPRWHRGSGRVLVGCGLLAALSGLWMTRFYALPPLDGMLLSAMRWLVGLAMTASLLLGLAAARRRDATAHRAWMMRAYALGLGAGTQVVTHLPWLLLPDLHTMAWRTLFMGLGWAINLAVAEWLIARGAPPPAAPRPTRRFVSDDFGPTA